MSLQKYIAAAKAMQLAETHSPQWWEARASLRNFCPTNVDQFAVLMIEADSLLPKWQPIENAPRDGSRLQLYYPKYETHYPPVATYGKWETQRHNKKPKPYWDADCLQVFGVRFMQDRQPTHFMPLPGAPR